MKFQDKKVIAIDTTNCEDGCLKITIRIEDSSFGERGRVYGIKLSPDKRDVKWVVAAMRAFIRKFERCSLKQDCQAIDIMGTEEYIEEVRQDV